MPFGTLCSQEVDFAIAGISITYHRSTAVDYTFAYHTEPSAVAIKVTTSRWSFFFTTISWALLLTYFCAPVMLALLLWTLELVTEARPYNVPDQEKLWRLLDIYGCLARKLITIGETFSVSQIFAAQRSAWRWSFHCLGLLKLLLLFFTLHNGLAMYMVTLFLICHIVILDHINGMCL